MLESSPNHPHKPVHEHRSLKLGGHCPKASRPTVALFSWKTDWLVVLVFAAAQALFQLWWVRAPLSLQPHAPSVDFSSCATGTYLPRDLWDLPRPGSNPRLLHRQADSLPPSHQGSPCCGLQNVMINFWGFKPGSWWCLTVAVLKTDTWPYTLSLILKSWGHVGLALGAPGDWGGEERAALCLGQPW